jgi:hypothetical protein
MLETQLKDKFLSEYKTKTKSNQIRKLLYA